MKIFEMDMIKNLYGDWTLKLTVYEEFDGTN